MNIYCLVLVSTSYICSLCERAKRASASELQEIVFLYKALMKKTPARYVAQYISHASMLYFYTVLLYL